MIIAITGALGWLGKVVTDHFKTIGHQVISIDKPSLSSSKVVGWNIRDDWKTARGLPNEVDALFHFAAAADVNKINDEPMRAVLDNIVGTARVLEWAKAIRPAQVNIISTMWAAAYPTNTHPYTVSKYNAEQLASSWSHEFGVPVNILRLGTCYGPGGRGGTVITNFVKKAINNESLCINGSGQATRRYLYVDDLATACQAVLDSKFINRWIDICGDQEKAVIGIAYMVKKIVRDVPIVNMPARVGDLEKESVVFGSGCLSWKPKVGLEEGIRRYFDSLQIKVEKEEAKVQANG